MRRHLFTSLFVCCALALAAAGCNRPADNPLIGTWTVDKEASFAALEKSEKWQAMSEQEQNMARPIFGPVMENMTLTFTKTVMKQTAGAQAYETRYSIAARDDTTITVKIGSLMQHANLVFVFEGRDVMQFRGEKPRDMDLFVWRRVTTPSP